MEEPNLVTPGGEAEISAANHEEVNEDLNKEVNEELNEDLNEFIPGNLFNFEKHVQSDVENTDVGNIINKRKKKNNATYLGRPNPTYSSSLERDR
ncbi:hypothetical protein Hanom_Chr08g00690931 [Helianthus anomalus]